MSDPRRAQYLQAMGISAWRQRIDPPARHGETAAMAAVLSPLGIPGPASDDIGLLGWPELRARVAACTLCALSAARTQTVFGVGDLQAKWLIVGEAPGAEEDRRGEPFVGRAGQLLNAMLRAMGLAREQVYIANIVKCRPPGNREPKPAEAGSCIQYLHRQIALLQPGILLAVGRVAAQNLLDNDEPLGKMRQRVHRLGASELPVVVTYHPAYLLRSPSDKRKAWDDLKFAKMVMARGRSQT